WSCTSVICPSLSSSVFACPVPAVCLYPNLDQTCSCGPFNSYAGWRCSCPSAVPTTGMACPSIMGATTCSYDDTTCSCGYSGWTCRATCPAAQPVNGTPCSSTLNCQYGDGGSQLCACDGTSWTCAGGA